MGSKFKEYITKKAIREVFPNNDSMDAKARESLFKLIGTRGMPKMIVEYSKQLWKDELNKIAESSNIKALKKIDLNKIKLECGVHNKASSSKRPYPVREGEWIGVEIECFIPTKSLNMRLPEGEPCGDCEDCYNDRTDDCTNRVLDEDSESDFHSALRRHFDAKGVVGACVKSDGSINADSDCVAVEITVLFTRQRMKERLGKLCKVLNDLNARVNTSCGLHVHLDCRDLLSKKNKPNEKYISKARATERAKRLADTLPVLAQIVPKSRRDNSYCKLKLSFSDRYSAINCTPLNIKGSSSDRDFNTIEVRLHSGTTNYTKISSWVALLYDISRCDNIVSGVSNLEELFVLLYGEKCLESSEVARKLYNYFSDRINLFKDKNDNKDVTEHQYAIEGVA